MISIKLIEVLNSAKKKLRINNIDEREARLLLSYALGIKAEELIKYDEIDDVSLLKFQDALDRRCHHIPYAYIVGSQEFMKLQFKVNENVLIPRADTEILVEETIKICSGLANEEIRILDLCTGSGCIAISLAKYIKNSKVFASDISSDAIFIAKENALLNDAHIEFINSNLFESIEEKFDIIVSNPPYIKKAVIYTLEKEVKDNEPMLALDGGENGLKYYTEIIENANKYLNENGFLILEIGFDQANEVKELLEKNNYIKIRIIKDYSGNDRVVVANLL